MSRSSAGHLKKQRRTGGDISVVDVAERARVSVGTVSRVFNRHPSVAAELRERVLSASRSLGFVAKVPHRCIGVVTGRHSPGLPINYVSVMTSMVSRYLTSRRYAIELIDVENIELAYQAHIEGVIGIVFDDRLEQLRQIPNLPLLTVNHPMQEKGIHSIRTDHYQQAVLATEHLIKNGHKRIAMLQIQGDEWGSIERRRGYDDTLKAAGIEIDPSLVHYTLGQPLYDIVARLVRRGTTAILNFSEDVSLEVLHFLSNILNLKIGQDISVISLEDLPIYQYLCPPQTTVRQPLEELARLSVEQMMLLCDPEKSGKKPEKLIDICIGSELIQRDSVAKLDGSGKVIATAGKSE